MMTDSQLNMRNGMTSTQTVEFESFCQRMWLDYCDENNTILSEHLTYKEYTTNYKDYLLEKYESR